MDVIAPFLLDHLYFMWKSDTVKIKQEGESSPKRRRIVPKPILLLPNQQFPIKQQPRIVKPLPPLPEEGNPQYWRLAPTPEVEVSESPVIETVVKPTLADPYEPAETTSSDSQSPESDAYGADESTISFSNDDFDEDLFLDTTESIHNSEDLPLLSEDDIEGVVGNDPLTLSSSPEVGLSDNESLLDLDNLGNEEIPDLVPLSSDSESLLDLDDLEEDRLADFLNLDELFTDDEEENPDEEMAETRALIHQVLGQLGANDPNLPNIRQLLQNQEERINHLDRRNGTKHLAPESFYGYSTDDPRRFMDKFLTYVQLQHIPDDRRIPTFRMLLQGPADVWYSSLPEATKNNWANLEQAFLDGFAGANTELLLEQSLDNRTQGSTESAESYINDVLRVTQRLQKADAEVRKILQRGLRPDIKAYVIGAGPANVNEMVEKIKIGETLEALKRPSKAKTNAMESQDDLASILERQNMALAALATGIEKMAKPNPSPQTVSAPNQQPAIPMENVECYYCHNFGHYARNCRAKRFCQICGKDNHQTQDCYSTQPRSRQSQGQGQSQNYQRSGRQSRNYQPRRDNRYDGNQQYQPQNQGN